MRFFEDFLIYPTDFGLTLEVILGGGWREAAKRFPVDRLSESMGLVVQISQKMLDGAGMSQKIELRSGELGLQGISLNPGRCGIDLEPAQYKYISHNLTKSIQVLALLPLLIRYIRDLEHFKP